MQGTDYLDLVDWRRRVGDLYRLGGPMPRRPSGGARTNSFATTPSRRSRIARPSRGLDYFPVDPAYRTAATFEPAADPGELVIDTGGEDGAIRYRRAGLLRFTLGGVECSLPVLSLIAYAGGLFVPFKDATSRPRPTAAVATSSTRSRTPTVWSSRSEPGRSGGDRLQLRLQPVLRLQPTLGLPARAARECAGDPDPGRREELPTRH